MKIMLVKTDTKVMLAQSIIKAFPLELEFRIY